MTAPVASKPPPPRPDKSKLRSQSTSQTTSRTPSPTTVDPFLPAESPVMLPPPPAEEPLALDKIRLRSRFTEHFEHLAQTELIESLSETDFHVPTRKPKKIRPLGLQHSSSTSTLETIRGLPSPTTPTANRRPSLATKSTPPIQRQRQFSLAEWPRPASESSQPTTSTSATTTTTTTATAAARQRIGSTASLLPKSSPSKVSMFSLNRAEVIINRLEGWLQLLKAVTSWLDEMTKISLQSSRCYYQRGLSQLNENGLDATNASATVQAGLQMLTMQLAADQQAFGNGLQHTHLPGLLKLRKECKERIRELKSDPTLVLDELLRRAETTRKTMAQLNRCCKAEGDGQDPWLANLYVLRQLKREVDEENRLRLLMVPIQREMAAFEERLLETVKPAVQFCYERLAPGAWDGSADAETAPFKLLLDQIVPKHEWSQFVEHQQKELVNEQNPTKDYLKINYPNKMNPYVMTLHKGILERPLGVRKQFAQRTFALSQSGYLHQFRMNDKVSPERSIYIPNTTIVPSIDISHLASHGVDDGDHLAYTFEIHRPATAVLKRDKTYIFRAQSRDDLLTWCRLLVEVASRPATHLTQPVSSAFDSSSMDDDMPTTSSSLAHSSDSTAESAPAISTADTCVHPTEQRVETPKAEKISEERVISILSVADPGGDNEDDEDDDDEDTASTTSVATAKFVSEPLPLEERRISSTSTAFDDAESSVYFSSTSSPTASRRSSSSGSIRVNDIALPDLEPCPPNQESYRPPPRQTCHYQRRPTYEAELNLAATEMIEDLHLY
ncbi:hypothetical protein DFQ28_010540 [Apophysomyces sp. BC1034]|nr:hypothetical protein DFQ30_010156 [Apophysomyces sp. BC1015]KAG0171031.1 hypothetical protein DFQ29_009031 [Apophysomyces sp. BC1021]KAG0184757.1 hypothetical protein DFQ28_010540 [Apophysomyces sp. BC1034]